MARNEKGEWIGYGPGDSGAQVTKINHRLFYAYPRNSKAKELGLITNDFYSDQTFSAVKNIQPCFTPPLPATGISNYDTQVALGAVIPPPPKKKFWQQGVGYPAMGFLQPDPNMSYVESRTAGTNELLRLASSDNRPKVIIGYSQGDDVVGYFLEQWPSDRRNEIKMVVGFGSPSRPAGLTLLGNDPGGMGISNHFTPEWARDRTYHFTHEGDWYPNARGLLFLLYDILTRMEISIQFASYLFKVLSQEAGKILLGIQPSEILGAATLAGLAKMVTTGTSSMVGNSILSPLDLFAVLPQLLWLLMDALKFISSNAHMHYHDQPKPFWRGLTAVDCAAQIIQEKVREKEQVVVYTVPGTWASWNDGPPAWTAWKLP